MDAKPQSALALPLTFGGVAELARGARGQLMIYRLVVALFAAASLAVFFERAWVPVINRTILALPPQGYIRNEELTQIPPTPVHQLGSGFLAVTIDAENTGTPGEGADVQVRLLKDEIRFRSLFGDLSLPYPEGLDIPFDRTDVEPWWGAWHPGVTAALAASVLLGLLMVWAVLSVVYAWPVRLIVFFADRDLSWAGAWRLSGAALLPGALFLTIAILAYTFRQLNLVQLLAAVAIHFVIGWVYVLCSPFCVPSVAEVQAAAKRAANPFKGKQKTARRKNPFAGPPAA
jgi:hypothetical protein